MKFVYILILTIIFLCHKNYAQEQRLSLYYNIGEVQSPQNFRRIDSLWALLNEKITGIKIFGYADFLNDSTFNQKLSFQRAEAVKKYVLTKIGKANINISCRGFGERSSKDNASKEGEPLQRRVDVILSFLKDNSSAKATVIKSTVKKDTVAVVQSIETLKKGESLAIEGLSFYPGRHVALKSAMPVLENLVKTLKQNPKLKIEIQGHICCIDGEDDGYDFDSYDRKLSENRARVVYDFLVKSGIDAERLQYKGYGHSYPKIAFETTPEEEQVNRRVEIKILEN